MMPYDELTKKFSEITGRNVIKLDCDNDSITIHFSKDIRPFEKKMLNKIGDILWIMNISKENRSKFNEEIIKCLKQE